MRVERKNDLRARLGQKPAVGQRRIAQIASWRVRNHGKQCFSHRREMSGRPGGSFRLRKLLNESFLMAISSTAAAVSRPASWMPPKPSSSGNRPMIRFSLNVDFNNAIRIE